MGKRHQQATERGWGPRPKGTIWSPSLAREVPPRFLWLYTVLLPVIYGICTAFGVAAAIIKIPSLRTFTSEDYAIAVALAVGVLGIVGFVALIARVERAEFIADVFLFALIGTYPAILLITGFAGTYERIPSGIGLLLLPAAPAARAIDIVRTVRRRIATAGIQESRSIR